MIALDFASPWLLLGLLAVAIPLLLHLLARSRAQEVLFPTLRFLRISMEKTARRRRVQNVLLMFLRMLLLGLLALAVAEPISQALGGWMGGRSFVCVLLVDNSMSMSARADADAKSFRPDGLPAGRTRLDRARAEAKALLSGADRPSLAALWTTNGPAGEADLTARLDTLRERADRIAPSFGKAPLAQRVAAAVAQLQKQSIPQKAVVLFTDLQKASMEDLLAADDLAKAGDVHLLVVNAADRPAENVAVTDVKVEGRAIVDQLQTVTARVENFSPAERVADVGLSVSGLDVGQKVRLTLAPAGVEGSAGAAKFNWWPRAAGEVAGEVRIDEPDALAPDNVRRFAVRIGGRLKALLVRGPAADPRQPATDPAWMLDLALNPFAGKAAPWLIETQTVDADLFGPDDLKGPSSPSTPAGSGGSAPTGSVGAASSPAGPAAGPDSPQAAPADAPPEIVFLCDVPKFTAEQASALERMAAGGGTVVIFLGPNVDVKNYNDVLGRPAGPDGCLLPAPINPAVGDVGPTSAALFLKWVDLQHPYFKGLYKDLGDVKEDIRGFVQRYYPLGKSAGPADELVRLENDQPLIVSKTFGQGRVVLCATSAAPGWSNLPATSLFPPMVIRMSLLARRGSAEEQGYLAGAQVTIRPRAEDAPGAAESEPADPAGAEPNEATLIVTPPPQTGTSAAEEGKVTPVTLRAVRTAEGLAARFSQTFAVGVYQWRLAVSSGEGGAAPGPAAAGREDAGLFVVNAPADESRLQSMTPDEVRQALAAKGFNRVYIGQSFAEASAAALAAAQKRNWWDVLAAAAIVALVVESLVANRSRKAIDSAIPAHLNPRLSAG